jgi:cytidylate kinase
MENPSMTPEFAATELESPLHGYQGDRRPAAAGRVPRGLAIALSREAGSRGASIAARVGKKLGWQVYHQELLDYIAQDSAVRDGLLTGLQAAEIDWIESRLHDLKLPSQAVAEQARLILALAVPGQVLLVGRGAGCLLPSASTLNVRIIAPLAERIAYMSQWQRLTREEAAAQVQLRDVRRAEFIQSQYQRQPSDPYQYDLLLNSSALGEELSVELIAQAAKAKQAHWQRPINPSPPWQPEVIQ